MKDIEELMRMLDGFERSANETLVNLRRIKQKIREVVH